MFNRLTVNMLLKSVIASLAALVTIALTLGAWDSWSRLNAASRIAGVAEVSTHLFTALHNLRVDRTSTYRDLMADKQFTAMSQQIRMVREAEMPALKSAMIALEAVDFPERQAVLSTLREKIGKLTALHEESAAAVTRPKAQRRQGLAQEFLNEGGAIIEMLDKLSSQLTRLVKLDDALIDQLMELKQLAWSARNAAGDASVLISNALGGQPLPSDPLLRYTAHMGKLDSVWAAVEDLASGLPLPARFTSAVDKAKREFFARDFLELRLRR